MKQPKNLVVAYGLLIELFVVKNQATLFIFIVEKITIFLTMVHDYNKIFTYNFQSLLYMRRSKKP